MLFANNFAKKNSIIETLFEDTRDMDKTRAINFVAEALRLKASAIFLVGGFPCKGLSRAREAARDNFKNKDSIFGSSNASETFSLR